MHQDSVSFLIRQLQPSLQTTLRKYLHKTSYTKVRANRFSFVIHKRCRNFFVIRLLLCHSVQNICCEKMDRLAFVEGDLFFTS